MNFDVPHHIRRQFAVAISGLQETAGWEGTKAYLDLLSRTVESKGHRCSSAAQHSRHVTRYCRGIMDDSSPTPDAGKNSSSPADGATSVIRRWSCVATLALSRYWRNGSRNRIGRGPSPATAWTVYHTLSFGCPDNLPVECLSFPDSTDGAILAANTRSLSSQGDRIASSWTALKW
jgi:hypothetical protein